MAHSNIFSNCLSKIRVFKQKLPKLIVVSSFKLIKKQNTSVGFDFSVFKRKDIESEEKKTRHVEKIAIDKRSKVFVLSLRNFVKIITL